MLLERSRSCSCSLTTPASMQHCLPNPYLSANIQLSFNAISTTNSNSKGLASIYTTRPPVLPLFPLSTTNPPRFYCLAAHFYIYDYNVSCKRRGLFQSYCSALFTSVERFHIVTLCAFLAFAHAQSCRSRRGNEQSIIVT